MMERAFLLGLTGSIGMGKTTAAGLFREAGVLVWDADEAVHKLYGKGGAAVDAIGEIYPQAIEDKMISRQKLNAWIKRDPNALPRIEAIVHPLVRADRLSFKTAHATAPLIVFDIPLLFETGSQDEFDAVAVVSAPAALQRDRVMARPGMTEAQFELILSKQMPDAQKRRRADYVIESSSLQNARDGITNIMDDIKRRRINA